MRRRRRRRRRIKKNKKKKKKKMMMMMTKKKRMMMMMMKKNKIIIIINNNKNQITKNGMHLFVLPLKTLFLILMIKVVDCCSLLFIKVLNCLFPGQLVCSWQELVVLWGV
jgi:hypothetical protein